MNTKLTLNLDRDVIKEAKSYAKKNQIDIIITRNKKNFKKSKLPVLTAREYLNR